MGYFSTFIENFSKRVGVNRVYAALKSCHYACKYLATFLEKEYSLQGTKNLHIANNIQTMCRL